MTLFNRIKKCNIITNKNWYKNGLRHRDNGSAIECLNGDKIWYKDGKFHRDGGPAAEYSNALKEWWVNGIMIAPPDSI